MNQATLRKLTQSINQYT